MCVCGHVMKTDDRVDKVEFMSASESWTVEERAGEEESAAH